MNRKLLICVVIIILFAILPTSVSAQGFPFDDLNELFFPRKDKTISETVYLSGEPVGITADSDGITVIGINEFVSISGVISPAGQIGITIGDKIITFDGKEIRSVVELSQIVHQTKGKSAKIVYKRGEQIIQSDITPHLDALSKQYKIGVYVRDNASGIGTLTYIRKNMQFGCLGHPIVEGDKGEIVDVKAGSIYSCEIVDVEKGVKGNAGELKGKFSLADKIGTIYINNRFGVYGNIDKLPENFEQSQYPVATSNQIKPGKAEILTTVNGNKPKSYEIEILRVIAQTSPTDKGLVLRVTDKDLIEKTGGIVQGMSGSPIIQEGKFVGAVTHVFINDPTRGYGILAEWMLEN